MLYGSPAMMAKIDAEQFSAMCKFCGSRDDLFHMVLPSHSNEASRKLPTWALSSPHLSAISGASWSGLQLSPTESSNRIVSTKTAVDDTISSINVLFIHLMSEAETCGIGVYHELGSVQVSCKFCYCSF